MNERQAIATLKKLIGPTFAYRVDKKAPNAEQREKLRAKKNELTEKMKSAEEAVKARRDYLLRSDTEYQRLLLALNEAKKLCDDTPSPYRKKITVGRNNSLYFCVIADGDNWDEVVSTAMGKA